MKRLDDQQRGPSFSVTPAGYQQLYRLYLDEFPDDDGHGLTPGVLQRKWVSCVMRMWRARVVLGELAQLPQTDEPKDAGSWTQYVNECAQKLGSAVVTPEFFEAADILEPKGMRTQRYLTTGMVERMYQFDCALGQGN